MQENIFHASLLPTEAISFRSPSTNHRMMMWFFVPVTIFLFFCFCLIAWGIGTLSLPISCFISLAGFSMIGVMIYQQVNLFYTTMYAVVTNLRIIHVTTINSPFGKSRTVSFSAIPDVVDRLLTSAMLWNTASFFTLCFGQSDDVREMTAALERARENHEQSLQTLRNALQSVNLDSKLAFSEIIDCFTDRKFLQFNFLNLIWGPFIMFGIGLSIFFTIPSHQIFLRLYALILPSILGVVMIMTSVRRSLWSRYLLKVSLADGVEAQSEILCNRKLVWGLNSNALPISLVYEGEELASSPTSPSQEEEESETVGVSFASRTQSASNVIVRIPQRLTAYLIAKCLTTSATPS